MIFIFDFLFFLTLRKPLPFFCCSQVIPTCSLPTIHFCNAFKWTLSRINIAHELFLRLISCCCFYQFLFFFRFIFKRIFFYNPFTNHKRRSEHKSEFIIRKMIFCLMISFTIHHLSFVFPLFYFIIFFLFCLIYPPLKTDLIDKENFI